MTMINEDCRDWSPLYEFIDSASYPEVKGKCYLCYLQNCLKSKDLKRTSIITKKLSFFIREFVIFESTSLQEAMFDCSRHVEAGQANFSVSEIALL
jgi:hypothetical protein